MILITGGTGYIGPQLVNELRNDKKFEEHEIVLFDSLRGRFDYFESPNKGYEVYCNLDEKFSDINLVTGDVRRNTRQMKELVEKADYVFHLAAVTGASYSNDNKKLYWETIFDGTMNVFEAAKEMELEALVNISSCNIYGRSPEKELTENSKLNPINTYAKAKVSAEKILSKRAEEENVPAVSLRLATNFGNQNPGMGGTRYNLVINKFVKQALEGKPLTPYGNGKNWRPFMNVVDSARVIKEIAKEDTEPGEVYNAGFSDMNFRIEEIADKVKKVVQQEKDLNVDVEYKRERDPGPSYKVDFSKIQSKLGLEKEYGLETAIRSLIEHYDEGQEEVEDGWNL
jgi:UDP-glucose 4-epimerase